MHGDTTSKASLTKIDQLNSQAWDIRIVDSNEAQQLSLQAIELADQTNYQKGKAEALRTYGFCLIRTARYNEAQTYLQQAKGIYESLKDERGLAAVYEYLGIVERSLGNPAASLDLIFKALALSQQTGFKETETTNYYQIGVTYRGLGNYEKALDNLYKSLALSRSINFTLMTGYSINVIGSVYFETADYSRALECFQEGLILRQQSGDKWGEAGSLDNIGSAYLKSGDLDKAGNFCTRSLAINQATGDKKGQANALLHLAEIYKLKKEWETSSAFCHESLQIRQAAGDKRGEGEVLFFLMELERDAVNKMPDQHIFESLLKVKTIAEDIGAADLLSKTHGALYESYKLAGDYSAALSHLELQNEIEKELHKDAVNQKITNLEISYRAEESKKEAELFRIRNVELARLYDESKTQKEEIELQKDNLEQTLAELRATQVQLIQAEKMASLGELTAGIAHEIQNPLNFVNNFSDLNIELLKEMNEEMEKGNFAEMKSLANDIAGNEEKIKHHGKRDDAIVKGMLQHSRRSSGVKEPTDINALCDEYMRLIYHGLRAKDKSFNATLKTDFDESVGKISIIPQDIGRVILNLITNALYAVNEKTLSGDSIAIGTETAAKYEPTVSVSSKRIGNKIELRVADNGTGIPQTILDKIFQPFFTTKPTGQGTGLGLSLSYDIVNAHGGELKVETKEGIGSEFTIQLPV